MKNYKKSEVIGLLLNLGLEPQGLEVRPEFNKDHKLQHNSYLVFALDTESLLNIFPNVNSDFTENREIARKYYKGTNSTVGVQLGTIELNDDVKLYSDMEIFGIVKQIYNGNVMNGNLLVFKNKEVDKYMDKYRESIKHVVNPKTIESVNRNLKGLLYGRNTYSLMTDSVAHVDLVAHLQKKYNPELLGEEFVLNKKLDNLDKVCSLTNKINIASVIETMSACHNPNIKNNVLAKRFKEESKPQANVEPKLYNGGEIKEA